ncbi:MAG: hypothetical protein OXQ94_04970 [Gemmatimonadota bacterium]|nr:hypothetical protein [Gemmatimonadota bacterium]MDE2871026.1 hypothetical protein [Gemmatimonadota bacterium]
MVPCAYQGPVETLADPLPDCELFAPELKPIARVDLGKIFKPLSSCGGERKSVGNGGVIVIGGRDCYTLRIWTRGTGPGLTYQAASWLNTSCPPAGKTWISWTWGRDDGPKLAPVTDTVRISVAGCPTSPETDE